MAAREARRLSPRLRWQHLVTLALLVGACAVAEVAYRRQKNHVQAPHSQPNIDFASQPSVVEALRGYPKVRPPLYPLVLWTGTQGLGMKKKLVNETLFDLTILLFYLAQRRSSPELPAVYPLALYALFHPSYVNLAQYSPEVLFVLVSLTLYLALDRYQHGEGRAALLASAALGALLTATRYFGVFFLVPLLALRIGWHGTLPWRQRVLRLCGVLLVALLPVGVWMGVAWSETGYLSGMDRFGPRTLPIGARRWLQMTSLGWNLELGGKTLLVDFFSPDQYASHWVVHHTYDLASVETGLLVLLGVVVTLAVRVAWATRDRPPAAAAVLSAELPLVYLASLLAVWSIGNNDPLFTGFLYPSYPFLLLWGFAVYARVRSRSWRERLPFQTFYVGLVVVQGSRDVIAPLLPLH